MAPRRSIIPGLILVILGVIFLASNNGWWQPDWGFLFALWPLALVLVGVRLILPRASWADTLVAFLIVASLVGAIFTPTSWRDRIIGGHSTTQISEIAQGDGQTTDRLSLSLDAAATKLHLRSLDADKTQLYTATAQGMALDQSYRRDGTVATATITTNTRNWINVGHRTLDVAVARHPSLALDLKSGAADAILDLSELELTILDIDGGASSIDIKLGEKTTRQKVSIQGGASSITIRVPKAAALKITREGGLTDDNFDTLGLNQKDNAFTSPDFDTAPLQIVIDFDGGATSIVVERY